MGASLKTLRIIMVGPTGSGKGTLAGYIVKELPNFVHISPGDIMRREVQENTALGQKAQSYVNNGLLVPDELIVESVLKELEKASNKNCILDGFPRTVNQAQILHGTKSSEPVRKCPCNGGGLSKYPIDGILNLIVPDEVAIERTSNRWIHLPSGRVYSAGFREPRVKWKDDETGEELVQRLDDKPAVVAERLKIYKNLTEPVLDYYRSYKVNILDLYNHKTSDVWPNVKKFLSELNEKDSRAQ